MHYRLINSPINVKVQSRIHLDVRKTESGVGNLVSLKAFLGPRAGFPLYPPNGKAIY